MDTLVFLHYLTAQPTYNSRIAHIEHVLPREANYAESNCRVLLSGGLPQLHPVA